MPPPKDDRARTVFNTPGLVVTGASAEHVLAMKIDAARNSDEDDIGVLVDQLGITSADQALEISRTVSLPTAAVDAPRRGSGVSGRSRPRSSARRPTDRCPARVGDGLQSRSRAGFPSVVAPACARNCSQRHAHRRSAGSGRRPPWLCRAASANRPQPPQVVSQSAIESRSELGNGMGNGNQTDPVSCLF